MLRKLFSRWTGPKERVRMKLIVGLGNPGKQYEKTRHNIGFEVIDELANQLSIPLNQSKFKGLYGVGFHNGEKVILLKPLTYMNLSGESIRAIMDYYDIDLEDLVIIYDDLDLPAGKIRLRQKGSAGGHNGIKSTVAHLGTQEFNRIRIGIDRPRNGMKVPDYVLGRFHEEEWGLTKEAVQKSAEACKTWLEKPFLQVMNEFNQ
jgi:peptidyl-tRNA hydrolase, PTH1 family